MGYKAFLVAVDREACALYKKALDKYLPPEYSRGRLSRRPQRRQRPAAAALPERATRRKPSARRSASRRARCRRSSIVTEKLLTGFDAPILYCMYLDKPMRDHVLLQAIARVNRPYEDDDGRVKPCGLRARFRRHLREAGEALAFDSEEVSGVIEGLDVLKHGFEAQMEAARRTICRSRKA